MLHIPPGMSNTYTYDIPRNMPQGLYWYHSHLHGLTSAQVYTGLVGLLVIGRTDGNLPLVTEKNISRSGTWCFSTTSSSTVPAAWRRLNNLTWPQWVSIDNAAEGGRTGEAARYRPLLAPVNFNRIEAGNEVRYGLVCRAAVDPQYVAGRLQFIPSNLQRFTAADGKADLDVPANPSLPDYQRDVQFTVNGQFQPVIKSKAGQTEIWVLANVSDYCLHERPAHRDRQLGGIRRSPSSARMEIPIPASSTRQPTTAFGCSSHRRAGSRLQ